MSVLLSPVLVTLPSTDPALPVVGDRVKWWWSGVIVWLNGQTGCAHSQSAPIVRTAGPLMILMTWTCTGALFPMILYRQDIWGKRDQWCWSEESGHLWWASVLLLLLICCHKIRQTDWHWRHWLRDFHCDWLMGQSSQSPSGAGVLGLEFCQLYSCP